MKFITNGIVKVFMKNEKEGKEGKKYYSLICEQNGDCETVNCSLDVFNSVNIMQDNNLVFEFNSQWKSWRVVSILPLDIKK